MADTNQYISKIVIGGTTYDIKDAEARAQLSKIIGTVGGVMAYRGKTTTALTDGATTTPVTIGGAAYTPVQGDVVAYLNREYAWNGEAWFEFGSTGSLKALAFADTASGKLTVPTTTHTHSITVPTGITQGKVSASGTFTPDGSITVSTDDSAKPLTNEIIPEGTNAASKVTLTGGGSGPLETTSFIKPHAAYDGKLAKSAGTLPSLTITSKTIPNVTSAGTMFKASVDVASETLTLTSGTAPTISQTPITVGSASGWSAGSLPSLTDSYPFVCADQSGSSATMVTAATGQVTPTGTGSVVVTALPTGGTAAAQTFTGKKRSIVFSGTTSGISVSGSTSGVALTTAAKATGAPSQTTEATITVKPV